MRDLRQYIYQSISNCHASPKDTISEKAVHAVTHATGGIARLINQLMTEAIDCAAEEGLTKISHLAVEKAWSRLQQLPGPIIDEPEMSSPVTSIEFGTDLDDLDSVESVQAIETATEPVPAVSESSWIPQWPTEDIAVESPAETIARLEAPPVKAIDPAELFGSFESEESIEVSHVANAISQSDTSQHTTIEATTTEQDVTETPAIEAPTPPPAIEAPVGPLDTLSVEPMLMVSDAEEVDPVDANASEREDTIVWSDESHTLSTPAAETAQVEAEANKPKLEVVRADDTDLLWVTESVDVELRTPAAAVEDNAPNDPQNAIEKLQFDHREILQRMRG